MTNGYASLDAGLIFPPEPNYCADLDDDPLCQCQGCGAWRSISYLGKSHACWRAEDGSYEEGGTFQ